MLKAGQAATTISLTLDLAIEMLGGCQCLLDWTGVSTESSSFVYLICVNLAALCVDLFGLQHLYMQSSTSYFV